LGLRALDRHCRRIREPERQLDLRPIDTLMTDGVETASQLVEIIASLSDLERSMLVRRAVGISDRELYDTYGELVDVDKLVRQVVARVQGCPRSQDSNES
jgi:hypothetical protein